MSYVIFGFCIYSEWLVNLKWRVLRTRPCPIFAPWPPVSWGSPLLPHPPLPLGWAPLRAQMWMLLWEGLEGYGKLVVTSKGVRVPNPEICEPDALQGKSDFAGCDWVTNTAGGKFPWFTMWAQDAPKDPYKRETRRSESEKKMQGESVGWNSAPTGQGMQKPLDGRKGKVTDSPWSPQKQPQPWF